MPSRQPLALLFDLDGTLADSIALLLASFHHTFEAHDKAVPPDEEWIAGIGTPLITQMRHFVPTESEAQGMILTYREFQRTRGHQICHSGDHPPGKLL